MKKNIIFVLFLGIYSCNYSNHEEPKLKDTLGSSQKTDMAARLNVDSEKKLPFIGKRSFETREAISGTGTAHKYIEIFENKDVYFSFEQVNQADGTVIKESFYAGKFNKYLKSYFKLLNYKTIYYEIDGEKIYEIDKNNKRLNSEDCCNSDNYHLADKCPCEGAFFLE